MISDSALAGNEEYRSFIDKLTTSNVDRHVKLPMIAVMGDTSSGKSSLLSNLSLIELPSSDQLTTRCPIMLKMKRSPVKAATVGVIWKDPPVRHTDSQLTFPPETFEESNWHELTGCISRAQNHIVALSGREVASDVVNVEIWGPVCEDLTLIDLPGIVRATGIGESNRLVSDIQKLIDDYLQNPRCIILAVHPSNVDFHNSQIMADARLVDPGTKRTIPVLTKPDLIDTGAEASVVELLLGNKTERFEKGFHMVKGRGQASLNAGESIETGLERENDYFRNHRTWRELEDSLFGTRNLRIKLSQTLLQLIRESFPLIINELRSKQELASQQYAKIGDLPVSLLEKRTLFSKTKDTVVKGLKDFLLSGCSTVPVDTTAPSHMAFSARFNLKCKDFGNKLHSSGFANVSGIHMSKDVIATDEMETYYGKVAFVSDDGEKIYLAHVGEERSWSYSKPIDSIWYEKGTNAVYCALSEDKVRVLQPFPKENVRPDPKWIRELIIRKRPYALPVFVNNELFESFVSDSIAEEWAKPCIDIVKDIYAMIIKTVYAELSTHQVLKQFPEMLQFMKKKVQKVADVRRVDTLKEVRRFIESEKKPYTQDHYLFENVVKLRSSSLRNDIIQTVKALSFSGTMQQRNELVTKTIEGVFDRNQKMSVDDHMAEEMMHVLNAYAKVAVKRFCDCVPMTCRQGLLANFDEQVNEALLGVTDDEIEKLFLVPPDEATRRSALKEKLDTLDRGLDALNDLF